jgi:hypothetical protein
MRFRASGLNAVLSFGVVFRISRFDDGPLSRDCLVGELGFMRRCCRADAGKLAGLEGPWRSSPRLCGGGVGGQGTGSCPDNSFAVLSWNFNHF